MLMKAYTLKIIDVKRGQVIKTFKRESLSLSRQLEDVRCGHCYLSWKDECSSSKVRQLVRKELIP